jgi:hypothetical protein
MRCITRNIRQSATSGSDHGSTATHDRRISSKRPGLGFSSPGNCVPSYFFFAAALAFAGAAGAAAAFLAGAAAFGFAAAFAGAASVLAAAAVGFFAIADSPVAAGPKLH